MRIRSLLCRLGFLFLLTYGFFYFSYKWLDPTQVNTDFIQYYGMVEHPLDLHAAPSPWVFRQLTTLVASSFWHLHIYYPDKIRFYDPHYDQRIFFAMLLTNYLGVLLAAWVTTMITDEVIGDHDARWGEIVPLMAGMLCFFSFYLQETTITGMADGLSWALMAIGYYAYRRGKLIPFTVIMLLTIIQREIMPLIFLVFAAVELLTQRTQAAPARRFLLRVIALCCAVFVGYLLLKHFSHIPGNEYQTNASSQLQALLHFRPGRAYVLQVFMGQNLILILFAVWLIQYRRYRQVSRNALPIIATCVMLVAISAMANISNNAGRMLALLTPVVAVEIMLGLLKLDQSRVRRCIPM